MTHTVKDTTTRKFLGKTENFATREEANFEKKHLKAYLKGDTHFSFGKSDFTKQPIMFKTQST